MHTTPPSLLEQLKQPQTDPRAWKQFVLLYTPLFYGWTRRLGLQESDAADLIQDVFTTVYQRLPTFVYDRDRSFRAWLRTLLMNRWRTLQRKRTEAAGEDARLVELATADPVAELTEAEYQQALVRRALELMQSDFQTSTWRACWDTVVEGKTPAEAAADLGLTMKAVYLARARVLARLRQELQGLLE